MLIHNTLLLYINVFQFIDCLLLLFFRSVPDLYAEKLAKEGVLSKDEADSIIKNHAEWLNDQLKQADTYKPSVSSIM